MLIEVKDLWQIRIDDSKIIDHDGFIKLTNFMLEPCKEFQLLYRASENQFSAHKFHKKCDGKKDTLTLLET